MYNDPEYVAETHRLNIKITTPKLSYQSQCRCCAPYHWSSAFLVPAMNLKPRNAGTNEMSLVFIALLEETV
jgi:hypothetical protein